MRTKWERRTRPHGRLDAVYALQYWSRAWVVVLGILPVIVAMIVGTLQGTADEGLFFPAPGYPAFTTLSAGMIVPALTLLVASIVSLPMPLEDQHGTRRVDMIWLSLLSIVVTLVSLVLDEARPESLDWLPYAAVWTFAGVAVLLTVRGALGAMRLLPKSWRGTYRSTDSV